MPWSSCKSKAYVSLTSSCKPSRPAPRHASSTLSHFPYPFSSSLQGVWATVFPATKGQATWLLINPQLGAMSPGESGVYKYFLYTPEAPLPIWAPSQLGESSPGIFFFIGLAFRYFNTLPAARQLRCVFLPAFLSLVPRWPLFPRITPLPTQQGKPSIPAHPRMTSEHPHIPQIPTARIRPASFPIDPHSGIQDSRPFHHPDLCLTMTTILALTHHMESRWV